MNLSLFVVWDNFIFDLSMELRAQYMTKTRDE